MSATTTRTTCRNCFHPAEEHDDYGCSHVGMNSCKCARTREQAGR